MIYRNKPATVEAVRWAEDNEDNEAKVQTIAGGDFYLVDPQYRENGSEASGALREGKHSTWVDVCVGDWVVKRAGRLSVMTDEDFHAKYEPAGTEPGA